MEDMSADGVLKKSKRKTLIIGLITTFLVLLSSVILCVFLISKDGNQNDETDPIHVSRTGRNCAMDTGYYFMDENQFLKYFDYASNKTIFLCNKPNCKHNENENPDQCDAYTNHLSIIFIYNKNIYLFMQEVNKSGEETGVLLLYREDLDGKNRALVKNFGKTNMADSVIANGKLYYGNMINEEIKDKVGLPKYTGKNNVLLCAYDFAKNKIIILEDFGLNYSSGITFCKSDNTDKNIYFKYTYYDQNMTDKNGESIDLSIEDAAKHYKTEYYKYNTKNEKFSQEFKDVNGTIVDEIIIGDTIYFMKKENETVTVSSLKIDSSDINNITTLYEISVIWDNKIIGPKLLENGEIITFIYDIQNGKKYRSNGMGSILAETKNGFVLNKTECENQEGEVYNATINPEYSTKQEFFKRTLELYSEE